jgi:hypothetical protein
LAVNGRIIPPQRNAVCTVFLFKFKTKEGCMTMSNNHDNTYDEDQGAQAASRCHEGRNNRAPDNRDDELHRQAQAVGAQQAAAVANQRREMATQVVRPETRPETLLGTIHDPAKRAQLRMQMAIRDRDQQIAQDNLVLSLVREREFTKRCQYIKKRDSSVCGVPLMGSQIYCKNHWGQATRISDTLLPDERELLKADRKREREAIGHDTNLEFLLREHGNKQVKIEPETQVARAQPPAVASAQQPAPFPCDPGQQELNGPCVMCEKKAMYEDGARCMPCNAWVHDSCEVEHACPKKNTN